MKKEELEKLIEALEKKDRKVIMEIYMNIYGNESMILTPTKILDHHDLETEVKWGNKLYKWNTEIKAFNGDYKNHLIKKLKLDWVLKASPKGVGAIYAIINADTKSIYLYDLKKIDWQKLRLTSMYLWICETDHSKGKAYYDTYFFPRTLAWKVVPMTEELIKLFKK